MEGLWISRGLRGARYIPAESLRLLGQVAVLTDSPGARRRARMRPLFRRAVSTDGARKILALEIKRRRRRLGWYD